ncbi:MAG: hypothetical protein ABWK05_05715 [Pyrobaculum sp.]
MAQDVVVKIVEEAVLDFVSRLCECERLKQLHVKDVELAKVADEVTKAIAEFKEGDYGPVSIRVQKKFLGRKEVKVLLFGQEVDPNQLLSEISKARSRAAWISSDCSQQALVETLYKYEDRYLVEVAMRNFDVFKNLCAGERPKVEFGDAPSHVIEGVLRGIEAFLARHESRA